MLRATITIKHEGIRKFDEVLIDTVAMKYGFIMESINVNTVEVKDQILPCSDEQEVDKWTDDFQEWLETALEDDGFGGEIRTVQISKISIRNMGFQVPASI